MTNSWKLTLKKVHKFLRKNSTMLQGEKYYNARESSVQLIDQNNYTYTKEK